MSRNFLCLCLMACLGLVPVHAVPVIENNGALNIPEIQSQSQESGAAVPLPREYYSDYYSRPAPEHRADRWTEQQQYEMRPFAQLRRGLESGFRQLMRMFMAPIATIHRRSEVLRRMFQENRNGNHVILKRSVPSLNEAESPRTLHRIIPAMQQSFSNLMNRFVLRTADQNPENKESSVVNLRFTNLMSIVPQFMQRLRTGYWGNYDNNRKIYRRAGRESD